MYYICGMAKKKRDFNVCIENRKAFHTYAVLDRYVAGIQLFGSEVKAIREHMVSMVDAHCFFMDGELYVKNIHIQNLANMTPHDPERNKKLLLNKKELVDLEYELKNQGITLVPLKIFDKNGIFKLEIALAKGMKNYDKRQKLKDADIQRELQRIK